MQLGRVFCFVDLLLLWSRAEVSCWWCCCHDGETHALTATAAVKSSSCTGDKLQLQGLCAFDAAVHCASMSSSSTSSARNHTSSKHQQRGPLQRLLHKFVKSLLSPTSSSSELQAA